MADEYRMTNGMGTPIDINKLRELKTGSILEIFMQGCQNDNRFLISLIKVKQNCIVGTFYDGEELRGKVFDFAGISIINVLAEGDSRTRTVLFVLLSENQKLQSRLNRIEQNFKSLLT